MHLGSGLDVVLLRYLAVLAALLLLGVAVRRRAAGALVALLLVLGSLTWYVTWRPLGRPYGLVPGSRASFELALAAGGAAGVPPLESWVAGRANPRPLWSALWRGLGGGSPERATAAFAFAGLALFLALAVGVYLALAKSGLDHWAAAAAAFAALLASSVPLDAYRPFGFFFRSFFLESPHRALALALVAIALGVTWRGGRLAASAAAGVLLGLTAWLDPALFAYGVLSVLGFGLLARRRAVPGARASVAAAGAAVPIGLLPALRLADPALLARIPQAEEVLSFRVAFRDLFSISTDLGLVFVLGALAVPVLGRRKAPAAIGIVGMVAASYVFWAAAAAAYFVRPHSEPDLAFFLVRFALALAAGAGGHHYLSAFLERLREKWPHSALGAVPVPPAAASLTALLLFPASAPFLWSPEKMDPLYYPSLAPVEPHLRALGSWIDRNTAPGATLLASSSVSEYVSALSGRRSYIAERVLSRDEARARRMRVRALLRAETPAEIEAALARLGVDVLVLDESFRWEIGPFDTERLGTSGLLRHVREVEGPFWIYLPVTGSSSAGGTERMRIVGPISRPSTGSNSATSGQI